VGKVWSDLDLATLFMVSQFSLLLAALEMHADFINPKGKTPSSSSLETKILTMDREGPCLA